MIWPFKSDRYYAGGNRHKFSPRYSVEGRPINGRHLVFLACVHEKPQPYKETYVADVCEWCGKTIKP